MTRRKPIRSSLEDRLRAYSEWQGECLVWTGSTRTYKNATYGRTWIKGVAVAAHRAAYEQWVGPIPSGLTLDHLCRNTLCIRPEHLEPVTMRENILRGTGPTAVYATATHCKRAGHPLSGENLVTGVGRGGYPFRRCRICFQSDQRKAARKQREKKWAMGLTSEGTVPIRKRDHTPMFDGDASGLAGAESDRARFAVLMKGRLG